MKKIYRNPNFTSHDRHLINALVKAVEDTVNNKKTDAASNRAKDAAWQNIQNKFNSQSKCKRSKESLKKCWEKMKSEARLSFHEIKSEKSEMDNGEIDLDLMSQDVEFLECYPTGFLDGSTIEEHSEMDESSNYSTYANIVVQSRLGLLEEERQRRRELHELKIESERVGLEIRKEILRKIKNNEEIPSSYATFLNISNGLNFKEH